MAIIHETTMDSAGNAMGVVADSDGDERVWGGRILGSRNIRRERSSLVENHLRGSAVYPHKSFRRRFGIPQTFFYRVHDEFVKWKLNYWGMHVDIGGRNTIPSQIMGCFRLLHTGDSNDAMDDGPCMGEETIRLYFSLF